MSRRVVIVGGGITGLATAYFLRHGPPGSPGAPNVDVHVLEAGSRPGGKIRTVTFDGVPVDVGADAYLARRPAAEQLARRLGLGGDLVAPATDQVWLWSGGRLRPLPRGTVFGVPTDLRSLVAARVVGPAAIARVAAEQLRPWPPLEGDIDVAAAVGERVGTEIVDQLVEPLLGGVYAGRTDRLSVQATIPPVAAALARGGSVVRNLRADRRAAPADSGPVFRTVEGGLGRLVEALVGALPAGTLTLGVAAERLDRDGDGWTVTTTAGREYADGLVLTVPAWQAARLLSPESDVAAEQLATWRYASVAVVTLALPDSFAHRLPEGSGMLVPRREGRLLKAATWSSAKWPHLRGAPRFLIRCSVGRIDDTRALDLDNEHLADRVEAELAAAVGAPTRAVDRLVTRWPEALPQYESGHRDRVAALRAVLDEHAPGVEVAGAAYDGVGLAPCVEQAEHAARSILTRLA